MNNSDIRKMVSIINEIENPNILFSKFSALIKAGYTKEEASLLLQSSADEIERAMNEKEDNHE